MLPGQLKGSAYLVSHGGEAFPDLDLVLEGDGVKVILDGNTKITRRDHELDVRGDSRRARFELRAEPARRPALGADGDRRSVPQAADDADDDHAQSGAQVKQNTRISVSDCAVRILSHRVVRHKLIIKVRTLGAGRISVEGQGLRAASRRVEQSCDGHVQGAAHAWRPGALSKAAAGIAS